MVSLTCSANELPHDILCDIFYTCANIYRAKPYHLGWIYLSHVCRRWREVVLDLPYLWARIVCLFPDALDQILLRTRDALLMLDYDTFESIRDAERFAELLPRAFSVIDCQKRVWFKHYCHWEALLPGTTLPNLVELDVTGVPDLGRLRLHPEQRDARVNTRHIETPGLLRLTLRSLSLSFNAPCLRSLHIEHHHSGLDAGFSLEYVLLMLSSHPLLETLSLLHVVRRAQEDQAEELDQTSDELLAEYDLPLHLPHLIDLHIAGHPRNLETLWRSLMIPRSAAVRFEKSWPVPGDGSSDDVRRV